MIKSLDGKEYIIPLTLSQKEAQELRKMLRWDNIDPRDLQAVCRFIKYQVGVTDPVGVQ